MTTQPPHDIQLTLTDPIHPDRDACLDGVCEEITDTIVTVYLMALEKRYWQELFSRVKNVSIRFRYPSDPPRKRAQTHRLFPGRILWVTHCANRTTRIEGGSFYIGILINPPIAQEFRTFIAAITMPCASQE